MARRASFAEASAIKAYHGAAAGLSAGKTDFWIITGGLRKGSNAWKNDLMPCEAKNMLADNYKRPIPLL